MSFCRALIAYESGLLVLWDISEARAFFIGGDNDLQLKENVDSICEVSHNFMSEQYLGEKEIGALCWASSDGSILAVGYVDGDILFWNTSNSSSHKIQQGNSLSSDVVRLQLSSAEQRLPIVVLQWSPSKKSCNNSNGLLFIYGGDQIGSDELLTVRIWILIHFIPLFHLLLEFGFCYSRIVSDFSSQFRSSTGRWQLI